MVLSNPSPAEPGPQDRAGEPGEPGEDDGFGLELDDLVGRLDAFQLLRHSDSDEASAVLADMGATSPVDREIVLQLGAKRPLGHPDRFPEAHSLAVRALEVLDRNGHRDIPMPPIPVVSAIGGLLTQIITQFIVRSYLSKAIDEMRWLYTRREAAAIPGDPHLPLLTRARRDVERLTPGFKRNPLALPTFLFGGAILSSLLGAITSLVQQAVESTVVLIVAAIVAAAVMAIASWVIVLGTAVARRRINLTTRQPMDALWETVGRAGHAPTDHSRVFAVIALILTIVSVVVVLIPLVVAGFS